MIKVEVTTSNLIKSSGVTKEGAAWSSSRQEAWLHIGASFPIRFSIRTDKPYPIGTYILGPSSFTVGQYGDLRFSYDLELVPEKATGSSRPGG